MEVCDICNDTGLIYDSELQRITYCSCKTGIAQKEYDKNNMNAEEMLAEKSAEWGW